MFGIGGSKRDEAAVIDRISRIEEKARELRDLISRHEGRAVEYVCEGGEIAPGQRVYSEPGVFSTIVVTVGEGCSFRQHMHPDPVTEHVVVLAGVFRVEVPGECDKTLSRGEGAYFRPEQPHRWTAVSPGGGRVVGITVPPDVVSGYGVEEGDDGQQDSPDD